MRILEGQKAIEDAIKNSSSGGPSRFLKLEDKETVNIRFLQEFGTDGDFYDEERGTVFAFFEHANPKDFKQSFVCTSDDGKCAGCESVPRDKGWRARGRLFANVLVRGGRGKDDEVKVYTTTLNPKFGKAQELLAFTEEYGSLCDRDYKLTRKGAGRDDTTYILMPKDKAPLKPEEEKAEVVDLNSLVRNLNYDEQLELIGGDNEDW